MKISIIAQTQEVGERRHDFIESEADIKNAEMLSGHAAAVCYMPKDFSSILAEPVERTVSRLEGCIKSGHHSVMDHMWFSLCIEECPKILAMILNNEKMYATSEKSARYTKMAATGKELELYNKWVKIYQDLVIKNYPSIDDEAKKAGRKVLTSEKLAQENARYLISVFTPATTMVYSTSWRQIQYIMHWMENFKVKASDPLSCGIKKVFNEFLFEMYALKFEELDDMKSRTFSFFGEELSQEQFGECYATSYVESFSALAQAQRHRTINYQITGVSYGEFFVPKLLKDEEKLKKMWKEDMITVCNEGMIPQGTLLTVKELGNATDFLLKCKERLCGRAQLEVSTITYDTLNKYYVEVLRTKNVKIAELLKPYIGKARCMSGFKCKEHCYWGPNNAFHRKV